MRRKFLLLNATFIGVIVTLSDLQQKIFADSEYPHSDTEKNPFLLFIIGAFVIAIIVVSVFILLKIRYKNDMKRLEDEHKQETLERQNDQENQERQNDQENQDE